MAQKIVIAGGGIGGLAAALACAKAGVSVQLLEQAAAFAEVGAGVQLGPNVVRILHGWGLEESLKDVVAFPSALKVRDALTGADLGSLQFGDRTRALYGAPYVTIHRADLQQLLLTAAKRQPEVRLRLGQRCIAFQQTGEGVDIQTQAGLAYHAEALLGADGLWSMVRKQLLQDGGPRVSGHLAYRAMVEQKFLPENLRSQLVTAWLGPRLHVVQYPVRQGAWLNVVAIVHGQVSGDMQDWDHRANAMDLRAALAGTCADLRELIAAIDAWRLWPLCDRPPMAGAQEQAQGRVALLGDAAHPMRPYMAQGAGMAIEDAACLQQVLGLPDLSMEQRLKTYAQRRWQRNAQVQTRSIRNGEIFHATGVVRWGRDLSLKVLGERLLDVPWLYRGPMQ
ncbi:MAG: FAD-dependent monooxygenase [Rhodoferax sp.]|nr:FAD-dependent monooxygenase [Rhodoferax sp.]